MKRKKLWKFCCCKNKTVKKGIKIKKDYPTLEMEFSVSLKTSGLCFLHITAALSASSSSDVITSVWLSVLLSFVRTLLLRSSVSREASSQSIIFSAAERTAETTSVLPVPPLPLIRVIGLLRIHLIIQVGTHHNGSCRALNYDF